MWCTPTHRVKQKRRGSSQKGSKSWCHGVSPVNIVQYAFPTHAPSPCVPTTAITEPFSLQGVRACWSLGCEGVQRGCVPHAMTEGVFKGKEKGTRTKLGVWAGCGYLEMGLAQLFLLGGCNRERGNELNVKHCGLLTQSMKTCEQ